MPVALAVMVVITVVVAAVAVVSRDDASTLDTSSARVLDARTAQALEQKRLVRSAISLLGVPYLWGGVTEEGFDCSGFTRHVYERATGLVLPRLAVEQAYAPGLQSVRRDEIKPGDLVFFNTRGRAFSHVGIYIGASKFIHAPRTGSEVRVDDMNGSYWAQRFNGARRALVAADVFASESEAMANITTPTFYPSVTIPPHRQMVWW